MSTKHLLYVFLIIHNFRVLFFSPSINFDTVVCLLRFCYYITIICIIIIINPVSYVLTAWELLFKMLLV